MVTPTILARDNSTNGWPFAFLTYDAERGFVPAAYTAGLEGGATSIAYVGENTVLTHDAHVYALVVDHRAKLVITNDVKISSISNGTPTYTPGASATVMVTKAFSFSLRKLM